MNVYDSNRILDITKKNILKLLDLRNQNIEKDSSERNYLNFIKFNLETIKKKKEY